MKYEKNRFGLGKNNFTELAPRFNSDLFDPKLLSNRNPDPMGISKALSRLGREGSDKDSLKMGCENVKLFLRKALVGEGGKLKARLKNFSKEFKT